MGLEELSARDDRVLCASTNEDGTEDAEPLRSWLIGCWVEADVGVCTVVGVGGSGVVGLALSEDAAKESPRAGLSACLGGGGATVASLRFGSSNGFTPDPADSSDTGERDPAPSTSDFGLLSTGEMATGDLLSADTGLLPLPLRFFGTSCNLNPSLCPRVNDPVSKCCGFGLSDLPSGPVTIEGDAAADAGVLCPEVSRFLVVLPFS